MSLMQSLLVACGAAVAASTAVSSASSIGLQRGMRLQKKVPPATEELGSADKAGVSKGVSFPLAEENAAADSGELSLAAVSVLGLQRSVTIRKRPKASSGAEEQRRGVSWPLEEGAVAATPMHPAGLSLADVSLLGLQRSAKIVRRQPPKASPSAAGEQRQITTGGSLLGLQRSMRLIPGGVPGGTPGAFMQKTARAAAEDLGA